MIVGSARVSTDGQSLEAQHAALKEAGAERVFSEKQSGAKTDRAALARPMGSLADFDSQPNSGRPNACKSSGRPVRSEAKAHEASTGGGLGEGGGGRNTDGRCKELQRQSHDD
jgi:Resolvase, N terminal domain